MSNKVKPASADDLKLEKIETERGEKGTSTGYSTIEEFDKKDGNPAADIRDDGQSCHLGQYINTAIGQFENGQKFYSKEDELPIFDLVKCGDIETMQEKFDELLPETPLRLEDPLRNREYAAIVWISMASKAAMQGGLPFRKSMIFGDSFLQKVSKCNTESEINAVLKEAILSFTWLVYENHLMQSSNGYIERCRKYISDHIQEKLSLEVLAAYTGISPTYLSRVFRQTLQITVTDYIRQMKIRAAKDMIRFSGRHINEISDYLGFSSLSYFSRTFQKVTGETPQSYRSHSHLDDE
jgi:AraC family transcriptional regulator